MPASITEQRFREGSGVRYLVNGEMRCHAMAKNKLRKYREEFNDYVSPKEDLWPECQCTRGAEPGAFACRWHGGQTPKKNGSGPRSLLEVIPVDLADKLKTLLQNPQYLNRREDIVLIQARVWQLMEELSEVAGSDEAWSTVNEARVALMRGEEEESLKLLELALKDKGRSKEIWDEVRKNTLLIKELTNTQVRTAKDLKQMATTEQVMALVTSLYEIVDNGANKYIDDPTARSNFRRDLSTAISRYANLGPATVGFQVGPGRTGGDGEA